MGEDSAHTQPCTNAHKSTPLQAVAEPRELRVGQGLPGGAGWIPGTTSSTIGQGGQPLWAPETVHYDALCPQSTEL